MWNINGHVVTLVQKRAVVLLKSLINRDLKAKYVTHRDLLNSRKLKCSISIEQNLIYFTS